jgi:hypothetical protein
LSNRATMVPMLDPFQSEIRHRVQTPMVLGKMTIPYRYLNVAVSEKFHRSSIGFKLTSAEAPGPPCDGQEL